MEQIKFLTREQIGEKLKKMEVDDDKIWPHHYFGVITPNPDYDPENYDPTLDEMGDYMAQEESDGQLFRVVGDASDKSNEWWKNHTKICKLKMWPAIFLAACINWTDGTRNFYSEEYIDKIIDFSKEYGGVVDFW